MNRSSLLIAAALAGAFASPGPAIAIRSGERAPDLFGWKEPGRGKGRSRSMRAPRTSLEAYKAQRRANRLRRKALNK